jgi:hypothetical protein
LADVILRDLGLLLLARSLGYVAAHKIDRNREDSYTGLQGRVAFACSAGLTCRSPLVLGGYALYLVPHSLSSRILGISLIGFVQGVSDQRYEKPAQEERSTSRFHRIGQILKHERLLGGLIVFASLLEKFRFLDCQGPPTPLNYTCPFGLELSGYFFTNQLVVESQGVNLAILAGVAQYCLRRIARMLQVREIGVKKIARFYLDLTNRMQFDLISILPFVLIQSKDKAYSSFYSYNPAGFLTLLGFSFGSHKEEVDAVYNS